MRILCLTPYLPSESTGHAGAQYIFRNIVKLSQEHTLHILCFINEDEEAQVKILRDLGITVDVVTYNRTGQQNKRNKLIKIMKYLPAFVHAIIYCEPFMVAKYRNSRMAMLLKRTLKTFRPDIVHIEYNLMNHYIKYVKPLKCVITEHDVTSKFKERLTVKSRTVKRKATSWISFQIWKRYEPRMLRQFDAYITLTKEDLNYTRHWKYLPPGTIIPPQVSVKLSEEINKEPNTLCFVGSFNRIPNLQAIDIIIGKIFPTVKSINPQLTLKIAGRYLPEEKIDIIKKMDGIKYYGFVPDVDTFIASSVLFIAPIITGAGLKMKITHALACGTPVLTTSVGAEGIPVTAEEGLWVVDDISKMVEICSSLILKTDYLEKVGKAAQQRVNELFSSDNIITKLTELYVQLSK
jgi:glycosyltransferase involved in cell wall biosynthesis